MPRPSRAAAPALVLAVLASVAGCGGAIAAQSEEHSTTQGVDGQVGDMKVLDATLTLTTGGNAQLDLSLYNGAQLADTLVTVSSSAAAGGNLPASAVATTTTPGVVVPAQTAVLLDQPGQDLSLTSLTGTPLVGQVVPVILTFTTAGSLTLQVPIVADATAPPPTKPDEQPSQANVASGPSGGSS